MRSEATIRMRSSTSYISRTLPLASSWRESSVAASLMPPKVARGVVGKALPATPRIPQLASYLSLGRLRPHQNADRHDPQEQDRQEHVGDRRDEQPERQREADVAQPARQDPAAERAE